MQSQNWTLNTSVCLCKCFVGTAQSAQLHCLAHYYQFTGVSGNHFCPVSHLIQSPLAFQSHVPSYLNQKALICVHHPLCWMMCWTGLILQAERSCIQQMIWSSIVMWSNLPPDAQFFPLSSESLFLLVLLAKASISVTIFHLIYLLNALNINVNVKHGFKRPISIRKPDKRDAKN